MNIFFKTIFTLSFIFIVDICFAQQKNCFINADKNQFNHYIDSCINEVIIDVRTAKEFKKNPKFKSINAPTVKDLLAIIDTMDIDTPVLVYCDEGTRSIRACEIICEKNFKLVVNLTGGIKSTED